MSGFLTSPDHLTFTQWAASILVEMSARSGQKIIIPIPNDERFWRVWAFQLLADNRIKNVPIPAKNVYSDKVGEWKEWAYDFIKCGGYASAP